MLQFSRNKQLFYVPVILILKVKFGRCFTAASDIDINNYDTWQSLIETTDVHIYNELIRGNEENTFLKGWVSSKSGYM